MASRRALIAALVLLPAPALAQRRRELSVDQLFEALKLAPTDEAARAVEAQIWQAWLQQGSPAVQLLMRRGMRHLHARALDDALEDFDAVIALAPEMAEGWNKRATVYFLRGEHDHAARDIAETLAREPRHFGALAGLSQVHEARGDMVAALRAYEAALAIHPRLPGAEDRIKELRRRALGEGI
jgi:tetratricopeptide (TPR) repeat protein